MSSNLVVLLIDEGLVVNAICADSLEKAQATFPNLACVIRADGSTAGPGWLFDGIAFTAPPELEVPKLPITKLQFLQRFTAEQRIAIRAARSTDPVIDDAMSLLDLAEDVETNDPTTRMFVQYLVTKGLLTADNAAAILE